MLYEVITYLASHLSQYVPPLDEQETRDILDDIQNWDMGQLSLEQIGSRITSYNVCYTKLLRARPAARV